MDSLVMFIIVVIAIIAALDVVNYIRSVSCSLKIRINCLFGSLMKNNRK